MTPEQMKTVLIDLVLLEQRREEEAKKAKIIIAQLRSSIPLLTNEQRRNLKALESLVCAICPQSPPDLPL